VSQQPLHRRVSYGVLGGPRRSLRLCGKKSAGATCLALLAASLAAQTDATFRDRKAWRLENDKLRVTVLSGGGHIAELVLKNPPGGREVNPLWIPPWPSIEPDTYTKEKHGEAYGADSEAATLSGIMGHNVCFDYWGAPSEPEFRAGLSYHGEVSTLQWKKLDSGAGEIQCRADLERSAMALTRTLRLRPGQPILYVEETVENHGSFDRPFGWVQHVTFGPPFVDAASCFFDASATRGERRFESQSREFTWPADQDRDFRRFSKALRSSDMAYFLLDPNRETHFISALNTQYRQLVAYVFQGGDFPWLNVWEQNGANMGPPWKGETRSRGLEFGNTRVSGTARNWLRRPSIWDTPAFGWLDAGATRTARYLALVVPIPAGFDAVRDIRLAEKEILIEGPRNQVLRVPFDPAWF